MHRSAGGWPWPISPGSACAPWYVQALRDAAATYQELTVVLVLA
jgi:hypothetical protein